MESENMGIQGITQLRQLFAVYGILLIEIMITQCSLVAINRMRSNTDPSQELAVIGMSIFCMYAPISCKANNRGIL